MRATLVLLTGLLLAQQAVADPQSVELWPLYRDGEVSPYAARAEVERITEQGEHVITTISEPNLALYLPPKGSSSATAVIVVPGGGHRELWMDHEGTNVAEFLNSHGIAAFVLTYRLARAPGSTSTIEGDALGDLKRAVRAIRANAKKWKVDPHKIGVLGFSAGGQLAELLATRSDGGDASAKNPIERESSRPDFAALVYPGTWPDLEITANTPPMFLLCGSDDRPEVVAGITNIYLKLREAKVPAELHLYDRVGHGFGLRKTNTGPVAAWPQLFVDWIGPTVAAGKQAGK